MVIGAVSFRILFYSNIPILQPCPRGIICITPDTLESTTVDQPTCIFNESSLFQTIPYLIYFLTSNFDTYCIAIKLYDYIYYLLSTNKNRMDDFFRTWSLFILATFNFWIRNGMYYGQKWTITKYQNLKSRKG